MVGDLFRRFLSLVRKPDRQLRIQIGSLMESALDLFLPEPCLLKDLTVRKKVDGRPCLFGLSDYRKEAFSNSTTGTPRSYGHDGSLRPG